MLKREDMTLENLKKEVLPSTDSEHFKQIFDGIKGDIGIICSLYDREEEYVIYCFYRLYKDHLVINDNYYNAYEKNRTKVRVYGKAYEKIG